MARFPCPRPVPLYIALYVFRLTIEERRALDAAAGLKASAFVRSQLGLGINVDAQNDHHDGGGQDAGPPAPTPELPSASAFPKGCCQTCGVPQVLRRRVKGITVCSTCEWTASGADSSLARACRGCDTGRDQQTGVEPGVNQLDHARTARKLITMSDPGSRRISP